MELNEALKNLERKEMYCDDANNELDLAIEEVGKAIRQERVKRKVSLRKYAEKIGISPAYLSDIERGNRYPSSAVINSFKKPLKP